MLHVGKLGGLSKVTQRIVEPGTQLHEGRVSLTTLTALCLHRKWEGGDPGVAHQKTPTCLLLTPDGAFHSFGYTARDYYHDLDPEEARDWLYFEKFKMKIHSATVRHILAGGRSSRGGWGPEWKGRDSRSEGKTCGEAEGAELGKSVEAGLGG